MAIALEIKGLRKVYDNGFEALKGIDLEVKEGDFYALLGPNGAGKSTTIGIVSSLVKKTAGEVRIFGHSIDSELAAAKREIGLVPQEFNFSSFESVWDIVVNQAGYYGLNRKVAGERAEKYLKKLGLWDKRKVASRMLSGGMKRRLMIARALVHEPRLLILDEPTAGVDIELRRSMWEFLTEINRSGTTIILTTHYLEEAESLCRHIAIIDAGVIVENTTMKALLKQLQKETFILDVRDGIKTDISVPGFETRMVDEHTLELVLNKGTSLNEVFVALNGSGIEVSSMRNKANRLEELFVALLNAK
ncbi:30S ribosomal protein S16 [gamma proteobacterium BDW918]|jgi:ABC-2 type transport system ATP-binding protein|uniref:ABC transporter n=1 Tax=Zhongshania aliphaticivorans TaxID=1470434 RepID=A0A127M5S4_9GAMM|nr:ABC transporter ATP-binding protein [Zhongshania aliphaticivorans]AMO68549.1 ABC transporter [Zhongshania aliphaticivorans]EIF43219.1 30S ribosomal protein S16 [gamma proteobacterium BDW918]